MADKLWRTLRTTVVWLPTRHWALTPSQIAAALTLGRIATPTTARLVAHLDPAALATGLPGSAQLATTPARAARILVTGGRRVVIPAIAGQRPLTVYHLPLTAYQPAPATLAVEAGTRG